MKAEEDCTVAQVRARDPSLAEALNPRFPLFSVIVAYRSECSHLKTERDNEQNITLERWLRPASGIRDGLEPNRNRSDVRTAAGQATFPPRVVHGSIFSILAVLRCRRASVKFASNSKLTHPLFVLVRPWTDDIACSDALPHVSTARIIKLPSNLDLLCHWIRRRCCTSVELRQLEIVAVHPYDTDEAPPRGFGRDEPFHSPPHFRGTHYLVCAGADDIVAAPRIPCVLPFQALPPLRRRGSSPLSFDSSSERLADVVRLPAPHSVPIRIFHANVPYQAPPPLRYIFAHSIDNSEASAQCSSLFPPQSSASYIAFSSSTFRSSLVRSSSSSPVPTPLPFEVDAA
ncbi:hypothetical protein C8R45DRAFT_1216462 [Mycena sanguinolenta]|nr:hypothetical protein C8R45DRAFT_1216462 [Mycena sanguinolenta]